MPFEYDIKLVVLGEPKPQKRHGDRKPVKLPNGRVYTPKFDPSSKDKDNFAAVVQRNAPERPLGCPLLVDIVCYRKRPKGHYGTGRNKGVLKDRFKNMRHIVKPDKDNLTKFVMDALSGVFWTDDSIIFSGRTTKRYSGRPRTEIFIKKY
jgi:Holliday junction resolvase RusA-like endonuclease